MSETDRYNQAIKEENARHVAALAEIEAKHRIKQQECAVHAWVLTRDVFYACGQTAHGAVCSECGSKRKLTRAEENRFV